MTSRSKHSNKVSTKVSKLVREGYSRKQAVAISLQMEQSGRLGPHGGYKRKRKGK